MKKAGRLIILLLLSSLTIAQDKQPDNIIILIGDGMGVNAVSTSILSDKDSPFFKFTSIGFSVTTALDDLITDSAEGATAISTGTKTNNGYISLGPDGEELKTLFEEAEEKGMSTGLVVTSSVTHATPAAFYAHNISRDNEMDIARQLIETSTDVVIGSGQKFYPGSIWDKTKQKLNDSGYTIFTDVQPLLENKEKKKIFALIGDESLPSAAKRNYTLAQLVTKALEVLNEDKNGFILMVEGSQIDWAGHENDAKYLLSEMNDFSGAVQTALDFAEKTKNTLILVTADHETGGMSVTDGDLQGKKLTLGFTSFYHTAGMVPVFAKGPSEEIFRGIYQNSDVGKKLFSLIKK